MANDLSQRAPQDPTRISTAEEWEIRFWTKELGVTAERLEELVTEHGNSAEKIRRVVGTSK